MSASPKRFYTGGSDRAILRVRLNDRCFR